METRTHDTASSSSTANKKRKVRATSSADEHSGDDGKKRGRPRVEKPDESAADRRRTQIRMAQRAYRQRKESTLEELRKRVSELTNTIELMNKAFLDHCDRLYHNSLPETQLEDVRETASQFEQLMKCVRNPSEDGNEEPVVRIHRESSSSVHGSNSEVPRATVLEPKNVPSWIDRSALSQPPKQYDPSTVGMGYTLYLEEAGGHANPPPDYLQGFDANALLPSMRGQFSHHQQQPQHDYDIFRLEVPPEVKVPPGLTPPRTYSFQESTFGRRLHRGAVEQGYHLLLDPSRHPATYERVFRLCLMNRPREKVLALMKALLDAGPSDPLVGDTAMIHVGGAGTHYPRRDLYGQLQPKKESWHMGIVGPQTLALLENAVKDNITVDMTVDIAGYEGEWLDPYDVEGYLAEKGIFIDPASSFAEAEVVLQSVPPSNASGTDSSVHSAAVPAAPGSSSCPPFQESGGPRPFDREQMQHLNGEGLDPSGYNSWAEQFLQSNTVGFSDASTGSWMNFVQPGTGLRALNEQTQQHDGTGTGSSVPSLSWDGSKSDRSASRSSGAVVFMSKATEDSRGAGKRKKIILDVTKFVKILIVSGVCLSRTPGYRRRDVDRALALASFDAF